MGISVVERQLSRQLVKLITTRRLHSNRLGITGASGQPARVDVAPMRVLLPWNHVARFSGETRLPMYRIVIIATEQHSAEKIVMTTPTVSGGVVFPTIAPNSAGGFTIRSVPTRPNRIAAASTAPTDSPNTGHASIELKMGLRKRWPPIDGEIRQAHIRQREGRSTHHPAHRTEMPQRTIAGEGLHGERANVVVVLRAFTRRGRSQRASNMRRPPLSRRPRRRRRRARVSWR